MMTDDRRYALHHVARELGGMTIGELAARMTEAELAEHLAFWSRRAQEREMARQDAELRRGE